MNTFWDGLKVDSTVLLSVPWIRPKAVPHRYCQTSTTHQHTFDAFAHSRSAPSSVFPGIMIAREGRQEGGMPSDGNRDDSSARTLCASHID